jgi:hypothetical protein
MAITRITAPSITGLVIPNTSINNASLDSVTALPSGIDTGKIGQVVQGTRLTSGLENTSTTVYIDVLSASITPSAISSKILIVIMCFSNMRQTSGSECGIRQRILRDSTDIYTVGNNGTGFSNGCSHYIGASGANPDSWQTTSLQYLDSPSSTSSITYKLQGNNFSGNYFRARDGYMQLLEVLA